jgi:hypothetical protein
VSRPETTTIVSGDYFVFASEYVLPGTRQHSRINDEYTWLIRAVISVLDTAFLLT